MGSLLKLRYCYVYDIVLHINVIEWNHDMFWDSLAKRYAVTFMFWAWTNCNFNMYASVAIVCSYVPNSSYVIHVQ